MPPAPEPAAGALALEYMTEIAVGTTARVDLCRVIGPEQAGRLVAVKRLLPDLADDPSFASRFLDEVWMTAALKHPNVVEVAGWGTDEQGTYLAVELVQGVSLARLMKTVFETGEAFTERMVVYIGRCLCRGLAAAHSLRSANGDLLQLVHRDLSPENVLVGFNGDVKIADFGLARAKERLSTTTIGLPIRPSMQMAPEEVHGHGIDHRADLFSLGIILFELLAGRPPWIGGSEIETLQLMLGEPPADLREIRPKMDRAIISIVMRCLEKDPAQRAQSAGLILDRLDTWLVAHGYRDDNAEALGRFVRRNAMRQMRWFERAVSGMAPNMPEPDWTTSPPLAHYDQSTNNEGRTAATSIDRKVFIGAPASTVAPSKGRTTTLSPEAQVAALRERAASSPPVIAEVTEDDGDGEWDDPTIVQKRASMRLDGSPPRAGASLPRPPMIQTPAAGQRSTPRTFRDTIVDSSAEAAHPIEPQSPPRTPLAGSRAAESSIPPRTPITGSRAVEPQSPPRTPMTGSRAAESSIPPRTPITGSRAAEPPREPPRTSVPSARAAEPPREPPRTSAPSARAAAPSGPPRPPMVGSRPGAPSVASRPPAPSAAPRPPAPSARDATSAPLKPAIQLIEDPDTGDGPTLALKREHMVPPPRPAARSIPNASLPRMPGRTGPQPAEQTGRGGPPGLTRETAAAESERLRAQAMKRADEARAAAEQARVAAERAERAASIAKLAEEAADLGREAVELAGRAGLPEASRRLDRARALEASIAAIESSRAPLDPRASKRREG